MASLRKHIQIVGSPVLCSKSFLKFQSFFWSICQYPAKAVLALHLIYCRLTLCHCFKELSHLCSRIGPRYPSQNAHQPYVLLPWSDTYKIHSHKCFPSPYWYIKAMLEFSPWISYFFLLWVWCISTQVMLRLALLPAWKQWVEVTQTPEAFATLSMLKLQEAETVIGMNYEA